MRRGPSLGQRIVARVDAIRHASRMRALAASSRPRFGDDDDAASDAEIIDIDSRRAPAYHARNLGEYAGGYDTVEFRMPDWFGDHNVGEVSTRGVAEFACDGLTGCGRSRKSVADVKKLVTVVLYRLKVLQPAVYAVRDHNPDYGPMRADFERLRMRVMDALKKSQDVIVKTSKSAHLHESRAQGGDAYDALVRAMRQNGADGQITKGDYDDLVRRVKKTGGFVDLKLAPDFGYAGSLSSRRVDFGYAGIDGVRAPSSPSGPEGPDATFGPAGSSQFGLTLLGAASMWDLQSLLASIDIQMSKLATSVNAFLPTWTQSDAASAATFQSDYQALQDRYNAARQVAQSRLDFLNSDAALAMSMGLTGDPGEVTVQAEYNGVVAAILQCYPLDSSGILDPANYPCQVQPGDLDDLGQRISTAAGGQYKDVPLQTGQASLLDALPVQISNAVTLSGGMGKVKIGIIVIAVGVGGIFAVKLFAAPTVKAALGLAASVIGGWLAYDAADSIQTGIDAWNLAHPSLQLPGGSVPQGT